jgi:hypothetical protein
MYKDTDSSCQKKKKRKKKKKKIQKKKKKKNERNHQNNKKVVGELDFLKVEKSVFIFDGGRRCTIEVCSFVDNKWDPIEHRKDRLDGIGRTYPAKKCK